MGVAFPYSALQHLLDIGQVVREHDRDANPQTDSLKDHSFGDNWSICFWPVMFRYIAPSLMPSIGNRFDGDSCHPLGRDQMAGCLNDLVLSNHGFF
jgi:hypothetical protein